MPRRDHAKPEVINQPLNQGWVDMGVEQTAMNPPSRPKSVPVPRGSLSLPEGMKVRKRPNFGLNKRKF